MVDHSFSFPFFFAGGMELSLWWMECAFGKKSDEVLGGEQQMRNSASHLRTRELVKTAFVGDQGRNMISTERQRERRIAGSFFSLFSFLFFTSHSLALFSLSHCPYQVRPNSLRSASVSWAASNLVSSACMPRPPRTATRSLYSSALMTP